MKKILLLEKQEGETPLETLEKFRKKHREYERVKMTYAGRLDPMASGILLVLAGEKVKDKEKYLALDKKYEFEILFGIASDTHDILGRITAIEQYAGYSKGLKQKIEDNLKHFVGRFSQEYPMYSSKTVKGRPLWKFARESGNVKIPTKEVCVKELKFLKLRKIKSIALLNNVGRRIKKVNGNFRQKEILKIWRKTLLFKKMKDFFIGSFKIKCGTGTYVRVLAHGLGKSMGIPALAFSIRRTKIGKLR